MLRSCAYFYLFSISLMAVAAGGAASGDDGNFIDFDKEVREALRKWEVPGVAVAAVRDGQTILTRGYGVRQIGDPGDVDDQTLFAIASNTKQMTATLLATFVDEKKLKWDDRVADYLPPLKMFDAYATQELTIRDLLCHRNGLPDYGGDIIWWGATNDRAEVLRRVRHVRPVSSFRSRWAYQNTMFIAAGEVAAKIGGDSWDSLMQERLFQPIGMTGTKTSLKQTEGITNIATPHMRVGEHVQSIAWRNLDNGGPAASVISNARDMAAWIRWLMNDTEIDGRRVLSPAALRELWAPQMVMSVSDRDRSRFGSSFKAYGLGWGIRDYHGLKVLSHGGWADGMLSYSLIVPERKTGVAVLTNLHNRDLAVPLAFRLLDECLGLPRKDWCDESWTLIQADEAKHAEDAAKQESERHKETSPSLPLASYTGGYANELYGPIQVELQDGQLRLKLSSSPTFTANLVHWHHDTFKANWLDPVAESTFVTFSLNAQGNVADVTFPMAQFIDPSTYTYKRTKP